MSKKSRKLAVASLAVGLVSCFVRWLPGLGAINGILLGVIALIKAGKDPQRYGGGGLAVAGIAASVLSVVFAGNPITPADESFETQSLHENERAALSRMRDIAVSEETYRTTVSFGSYGTVQELRAVGVIDHHGVKDGYRFEVRVRPHSFEAVAVPQEYGETGRRSFYVSKGGVIRAADKKGLEADAKDPPLYRANED